MEEIKVGEYCRVKHGGIFKIEYIDFEKFEIVQSDNRCWTFEDLEEMEDFIKNHITKHSSNILDLIEIGDILKIEEDGDIGYIGWEKDTTTLSYKEMLEQIKNKEVKLLGIVTKEQFNSIKYEVK